MTRALNPLSSIGREPDLRLGPFSGARGSVRVPGSKSISNRVLLLAALAEGKTTLGNLLDSDDTRVMLAALQSLGVGVVRQPAASVTSSVDGADATSRAHLSPRASAATHSEQTLAFDYVVQGTAGAFPVKSASLFLGNAGTAMRSLTAALALNGGEYRLRGVPRMHERPIGALVEALRQIGASINYEGQPGYPPLAIHSAPIAAGGWARVRGDVSSQFLSALLMTLPCLARRGAAPLVEVEGELISKPYIDITLRLMARFGATVERDGWRRFWLQAGVPAALRDAAATVTGPAGLLTDPIDGLGRAATSGVHPADLPGPASATGSTAAASAAWPGSRRCGYRAPGRIEVEGDASSASYFLAAGALGRGPVRVEGVGRASIQGDVRFAETLHRMGANVMMGEDWIEVRGVDTEDGRLLPIDMDFNLIPDAAMTLAVAALFASGPSTLRNIGSWRVKETDRLAAMATELRKLGAEVEEGRDSLRIAPPQRLTPDVEIDTYDDHRMAMCFSLASLGGVAVTIRDPGCVAKTFPGYFQRFAAIAHA